VSTFTLRISAARTTDCVSVDDNRALAKRQTESSLRECVNQLIAILLVQVVGDSENCARRAAPEDSSALVAKGRSTHARFGRAILTGVEQ
jgi:hypothetical protein